ncbi:MAG: M16 family metallopeptidase, partial [Planctomycetaceae bacterium]
MVTVRRVGDVPAAALLYHIPAGPHPDYASVDVLATVMASEPAGRLYEGLVRRRIAASCYGYSFALHDPGALMFGADAADGTDGSTLLQSLAESVETAADRPFSADEVERAKSELLKGRELQMANSQQVAIELSEWAAQGDWRLFFLHRDRLEKVTAADVNRVAKQYLIRSNRTAGVFEPTKAAERATIPATPDVAALLQDYQGRAAVAQGEQFDAAPKAIEGRLQRSRLDSGLKVTLLPKKTRGGMATLQLTLRYGNLKALENLGLAAELLPELLMR